MSSQERFQSDPLWESFKLTVSAAIRMAPLWILAGAMSVGALSVGLARRDVDPPSAVVRLGLTDQVVWPFYDVALNESVTLVAEAETAVRNVLGDSLISYDSVLPEGRGVVEVVIIAKTVDDAERGAQIMAEAVATSSLGEINEGLTRRRDVFRAAETKAGEDLERITAEIDTTAAQYSPDLSQAVRLSLEQQLDVLFMERDSTQRALLDARNEANQLERESELAKSKIELSNITLITPEESSTSTGLLAAVGVGVALLAAVGLTTWALDHGRIRSAAHLRAVLDVPVVPFPTVSHDSIPLARQLWTLNKEGAQHVGLSSIPSSPDIVHELSTALKVAGVDLVVTGFDANELLRDSPSLSDLDLDSNLSLSSHVECEAAFVVVEPGEASLRELRQRIANLKRLGLPVRGVILR